MLPGISAFMGPAAASEPAVFSASFLQTDSSTANLSTYTFTSQSVGAADSARHIIVAVSVSGATVSGVTVGGSSASTIIEAFSGGGAINGTWIGYIALPSGTTATVVVTASGTGSGCVIGMWRLLNWAGVADDTASDVAGNTYTLTIDVPINGLAVGAVAVANGGNISWTNATELIDIDVTGSNERVSIAHYLGGASSESGRLVSASSGGADSGAGCAVSFG